jgi:MFS family permease
MEDKIEKLFEKAGNSHKFQYIMLIMTFFIYFNMDVIAISLPYIETNPLVNYTNTTSGEHFVRVPLNYTICESGFKFEIAEKYNFSWTTEFDKECDKIVVSLIGSLAFTGTLIGSLILPLFANNIGRKNTVLVVALLFAGLLVTITFLPNFIFCLVTLLIIQVFAMLTCLSSFMNANEITNVTRRSLFGSIISLSTSVCGIFYTFLFVLTDSWRTNFLISASILITLSIIYYFVAIESPRYYLLRGNINGFFEAMRTLAIKNNRLTIFENELNDPNSEIYYEKLTPELETFTRGENIPNGGGMKVSWTALFTYPGINKVFLISCILWFTCAGNYYAITIQLKKLPGDEFLNGILLYCVEIVSCLLCSFAINWKNLGRKGSIIALEIMAASGYIVLYFFDVSDTLILLIVMCCRFAVNSIFTIIFIYGLELYPTPVRALGFGINAASSRISSILSPFLVEMLEEDINLVFASLNLLCLTLMFFMPETLNRPLLDAMPEIKSKKNDTLLKNEATKDF